MNKAAESINIKDMSAKELAELIDEIVVELDKMGLNTISICDDLAISSIRLKNLISEHQDLAQGKSD